MSHARNTHIFYPLNSLFFLFGGMEFYQQFGILGLDLLFLINIIQKYIWASDYFPIHYQWS